MQLQSAVSVLFANRVFPAITGPTSSRATLVVRDAFFMVTTWGKRVGRGGGGVGVLRPVDYPPLTDGRRPVQPA